jgi:hypothetical protein
METAAILDINNKVIYYPYENNNPYGNHYQNNSSRSSLYLNSSSSHSSSSLSLSRFLPLPSSIYSASIPTYISFRNTHTKELAINLKKQIAEFCKGIGGTPSKCVGASVNIIGCFFRYHAYLLV